MEAAPWFSLQIFLTASHTTRFSRPSEARLRSVGTRDDFWAPPLFRGAGMECLRPALKKRKRYSPDDPEGVVGGFTTPVTPAGAPSDAGDSVPGITPKSVTFPRGSKCQRIVGSADPKIDRTPIDLPCHCDGCGKYILTARHNCDACEDYDLCAPCLLYTSPSPRDQRGSRMPSSA